MLTQVHPAGERPRRPGLLAGWQHPLRRRRQRRRGLRLHEDASGVHAGRDSARRYALGPPASNKGIGLTCQPNASGLGISADGTTLVVANNYNDSISVIDTATRTVRYEHDLRPFFASNEGKNGAAGGTFPFAVVVKGNDTAYVSSDRDREVVVVDISSPTGGPSAHAHQAGRQRSRDDTR